eukprot:8154673-Karenia_brevis.AAC.1
MALAFPIFPPKSLSVGCNACGRSHCWTTNPMCPFFNRQRLNDPDAQLEDNVPHMTQTSIKIIADGVLQPTGPRSKANWWTTCRSLAI